MAITESPAELKITGFGATLIFLISEILSREFSTFTSKIIVDVPSVNGPMVACRFFVSLGSHETF